ncbi:hypothetical protein OG900_05955 [Streptomyces sp. NBC_00433]
MSHYTERATAWITTTLTSEEPVPLRQREAIEQLTDAMIPMADAQQALTQALTHVARLPHGGGPRRRAQPPARRRDHVPDHVIYNLPSDGRLVTLPGPGIADWDCHADPNLVEWQTRHRGTRAMALLRDRDSSAPPLAGGEDTLMMAAATLATPGGTEVIWWAGFSHDIPAPVTGAFLTTLLTPEPVTRPANSFLRPDLAPLLTTHRTVTRPDSPIPRGPADGWGRNRGPGGR